MHSAAQVMGMISFITSPQVFDDDSQKTVHYGYDTTNHTL